MTGAAKAALLEIALRACAETSRGRSTSFASGSLCEEPPNGDLQQIRPRPGQL